MVPSVEHDVMKKHPYTQLHFDPALNPPYHHQTHTHVPCLMSACSQGAFTASSLASHQHKPASGVFTYQVMSSYDAEPLATSIECGLTVADAVAKYGSDLPVAYNLGLWFTFDEEHY